MNYSSDEMLKDDSYYLLARPELRQFIPEKTRHMKILEVRCGAGNFIYNINEYQEYWGVEPNPGMAQIAEGKLDKVLVGSFTETDDLIPSNFFDLIICNDVIEHMDDVDKFLRRVSTKLKSDGVMIGSIPNVRFIENILRFLIQRDWKYTEWGILDKTHLRFFTEKSLKRLFSENCLSIESFRKINPVRLKFTSFKSFALNLILLISGFLMGMDSLYYQFGFRVSARNVKK